MKKIPKFGLVLSYSDVFQEPSPENPCIFIKDIPKEFVILQLAALNYRMKSITSLNINSDSGFQRQELLNFCNNDENLQKEMLKKINDAFHKIVSKQKVKTQSEPILFSRATNLLVIRDVINYENDLSIEGFQSTTNDCLNIFKYYLCINDKANAFNENTNTDYSLDEQLLSNSIYQNETKIVPKPLFSFERFYQWIKRIQSNPQYNKFLESYFHPMGFSPELFFKNIIAKLIPLGNPNGLDCFYKLETPDNDVIRQFEQLSQRKENHILEHPFDISDIRQAPFYKLRENEYILLDNLLLIEKCYEHFIKDFFDIYLRENDINYSTYRSDFGGFFEDYVYEIISSSFSNNRYYVIKGLDELKVDTSKGEIELADIYIRDLKKIFLAQIKSNGLRNIQFSGKAEHFFTDKDGNDSEFLYKNFGLFQLVESIKGLKQYMPFIDTKFPKDKRLTIYPALIVNEKLFHTPICVEVFNQKFQSCLADIDTDKLDIKPLTIFHIEDWQMLEHHLKNKKTRIWDILKQHHQNTAMIPPLNITLQRMKLHFDFKDLEFTKWSSSK